MPTLLAALDFSDVTERLLRRTEKLGRALNAKIVLLHVVQPQPEFVAYEPGPGMLDTPSPADEALNQELTQAREQLANAGLECETEQIRGEPVHEILKLAGELNVEMIIVGSHGHGELYHLIAGGVTSGLLKKSRHPILVVPSENKE